MSVDTLERGREIILRGKSLHDTLSALSKLAEEEIPGSVAGYTLVDPLHLYIQESVFPSLPPIFQDSISMIPLQEPFTGTCAKAICDGTSIISNDILADPGFDPKWRDLCLRCGVKSLQSAPFYADGKPQGTFVLGFKHETHDGNWNNALIGEFADLASQALRLYRTLSVSSAAN